MTKMNSSGESRQPCIKPRSLLKNGEVSPFIRTTKEEMTTQLIIQFIEDILKPVWTRIKRKKSQFTQSYDFFKSSFKIIAFNFFTFILCRHSCVVLMMSKICRPFKKPSCSLDIALERTSLTICNHLCYQFIAEITDRNGSVVSIHHCFILLWNQC